MDSASASSYKLQLAVAALVGASAAAASAYYLHCRAVAKLGGDIVRSSAAAAKSDRQRRRHRDAGSKPPPPPRRAAAGSASLPDLSSIYAAGGVARGYPVGEEYDDDDDEGGAGPYGDEALAAAAACMQIPHGLPRLQVGPEGTFVCTCFTIAARVGMWRLGVEWIGLGDELAWAWR
jgi:AMP deaminase